MDDDGDQQLIKSQITLTPLQELLDQKQKVPTIAKLTSTDLLFIKDQKLLLKQLPQHQQQQKRYSIDTFLNIKQAHEKGINKFKANNNVDQISYVSRHRKRTYSIDNSSFGAYYLYNWISSDQYPCEKPQSEEKEAHVIYQILGMRWHKALQIIKTMDKTLETSTLQFILKGFQTIQSIIEQEGQYYQDHFMNRTNFPITFKNSSLDSIGGSYVYINIFDEQSKNKFKDIKTIPRKVQCLKLNLDYLANFASKYKIKARNDYFVLAFKLLGNMVDQNELHADGQKQFGKILATLNLKLYDRINFATKLLPQKKRKFFCNELENTLPTFPTLDNILYYTPANTRVKQGKISRICKKYLDQYSDLQTVAYLSLDYPFLRNYYRQFKQFLQFSNQLKQLENIQNFRLETQMEEKNQLDSIKSIKMTSFFDSINFAEEKINNNELKVVKESFMVCQICCKKIQGKQNYLQCGKCQHGGHPAHLLKWFQQCQSCPHIGCPCTCN